MRKSSRTPPTSIVGVTPTTVIFVLTLLLSRQAWISVSGFPATLFCRHIPPESSSAVADVRWEHMALVSSSSLGAHHQKNSESTGDGNVLQDHIIKSLDLIPLMQVVARHTGTRRGHQALLSLVKEDDPTKTTRLLGRSSGTGKFSARRIRAEGFFNLNQHQQSQTKHGDRKVVKVARSIDEARQQYALVEAATLALSKENGLGLTYPPMYGAESHPGDTSQIEDTDNDEWLLLPADLWTLEHLLQAEKVLETLIATKNWASQEETATWMPGLSEIGSQIDEDNALPSILAEIGGRVEIVRVQTLSTYSGTPGYYFRLKVDRYAVLKILRNKEEKMIKAGAKEFDKELLELQEEINNVETQIRVGLAQLTLSVADVIDKGLDMVAQLDTIFAMAAFGLKTNGVVPKIQTEGTIDVNGFVHPVLASNDGYSASATSGQSGHVTPVDLRLSSEQGHRVLVISGPNGGGKTLSMKSFGIVCILAKLGIPIPTARGAKRPRVDFVDSIFLNVGDKQSLMQGESTWTSLLNSCSRMIETVRSKPGLNHLVLLDELGSGTDPEAGGAVAQAILEEFLSVQGCQVVATTHSPRLKALSFDTDHFSCASVLLEMDGTEKYKRPTFRLEYGVIGESYALGAASRCTPKLPDTVLSRASQLLSQGEENKDGINQADYMQALLKSMEEQITRSNKERERAENFTHEVQLCREAMVSLASSYETHLERLEQRLEDCYLRLREDKGRTDLEVIGDTLAELRVNKKRIKSQKEILQEKGLMRLPTSYELSVGESVVIIGSGNDWEVSPVQVVADWTKDLTLSRTEVMVQASSSFVDWDDMFADDNQSSLFCARSDRKTWVVQRHELAIWNFDSSWEGNSSVARSTSIANSKQRLKSLLSSLKSDTADSRSAFSGPSKPTKIKKSFLSGRARKAATSKKKSK